ncbi:DUF3861 domain-containing protein [Paenimyroides aestuarii]|uniref:DUF3861 domain-containing protein n=1 Tax=Paenimyroides aestuarii TaxID=2968490 RepID=A0ABY5NUX5_9FLAO|nr:DUF3861 domain-containing protein [Paenimyroides aestuarii]UUV22386.1 DUF3861 domain-containing protein [Paenimyroides aestuarii]
MNKKNYTYSLILSALEDKSGVKRKEELQFDFENHDDIFDIVDRIKSKSVFEEEKTATEFVIGLKLFTEVLLKNRKHPLFEELGPQMAAFMKKLKSQ